MADYEKLSVNNLKKDSSTGIKEFLKFGMQKIQTMRRIINLQHKTHFDSNAG